jgi:enoyl-[acyl-carrier protein] reductase II
MAGQSVGMVTKEEPVAEIIATLLDDCETALSRRNAA